MTTQQTPLPPGWTATWSAQHNAWYYFNAATNTTSWEAPAPPSPMPGTSSPAPPPGAPPGAPPQQGFPGQPQYAPVPGQPPVNYAPPPGQAAPAQGGIMGKFAALDPKAQLAIGAGGGLLAGALVEHEVHDFQRHGHHLPGMGNLGGLAAAAGVGALGAKLLGGRGQTQGASGGGGGLGGAFGGLFGGGAAQQQQQPVYPPQGYPPQGYPPQGYPPQGYPGQPGQPGFPPQPGYPPQGAPPPPYGAPPPGVPPPPGASSGLGNAALGGLAGVAGATVIGSMMHKDGAPSSGPDRGLGSFFGGSSGDGSASNYDGPPLYIQAAIFGDRDVTQLVRSMVDPQQKLSIKGSNAMREVLGNPWPEAEYLALTVLYQYGDRPMEVKNASTWDDNAFEIVPQPLSKSSMAFVNAKKNSRIIACVWGYQSVLNEARISALDNEGELEADRDALGNGGWSHKRTLQCFYYDDGGRIATASVREGGTLRLPWNPLAKWN